ncbi:MAG TPA: acetylornithine deacetylase/succinyl-diaminopimelate desuccinylase family protein [Caulobacteraceae bacterium]|nr:acetylornithine deacetylase/succinyl-diaminopimelate desuccinylase family protein [Caulobacteraceae bacterium]
MTHPREDLLLASVEAREEEIVDLARALIRIPSVNPPGEFYRDCAELLGRRLAPRGFQVEYLRAEGAPGDCDRYPRWNLVARREGESTGPCVHFNGHIDVVAPGEGWSRPPFEAQVIGGRIYGRGACDMKGGLAAAVIAVEALIDAGAPLPGAIEISGTGDEESGGLGGVAWLAERGWFSKPKVDHVIIPEPLNVDRVCIGHRGVWWGEIETKGRIAHGSMPFLGDSAIRHMAAVLEAFERELYPALDGQATAMPVEPPGARTPTLNINSVHGGQPDVAAGDAAALPAPLVADACRLVFDRRLLIEEDLDDVKASMHALLDGLAQKRPGFRYSLRDLLEVRPSMTEPDRPVVRAAAEAVRRVLGREAKLICSPGTYDQKHIDRIGSLRDCIAYGPGILDLAHQPDEYVEIADMTASAKVMALAAYSLLSGETD